MSPLVEVRAEGEVAVVTLSRPEKLNAISQAMERELLAAVTGDVVASSRAVVLTGAGTCFSAGADISEPIADEADVVLEGFRGAGDVNERVATLPQPTFSAIHGWCLGAAFELALATDFRIADESSVFGLPEVAMGAPPASGGLYRLVRIVGPARAKEMTLLHDRIDAAKAAELGALTEVVPEGTALDRARELASRVADLPPLAAAVTKQGIDVMVDSSREASILLERLGYAALATTPAAKDGVERVKR